MHSLDNFVSVFLICFIFEIAGFENIINVRDIYLDLHHWLLVAHRESRQYSEQGLNPKQDFNLSFLEYNMKWTPL